MITNINSVVCIILTRNFPITSIKENKYILILYHHNSNTILLLKIISI